MRRKITVSVFCCLLLLASASIAQTTFLQDDNIRYYNRGLDLFEKEKYGAAQRQFNLFIERCKELQLRINAEYYVATCAMELLNPDAVQLFNDIISKYPDHPKAKASAFQLGRYYFRQKEYGNTLDQLQKVDVGFLAEEELSEYYFMTGYCYFRKEKYPEAKTALHKTLEVKNKYYFPANYYYGYICYMNKELDEALASFEKVKGSKIYSPVAPLYISQIMYAKGQFNTLIPYADTISNKEIVNDVALVLAQTHYEMGSYDKAQPYFEKYKSAGKTLTREESYRMAYTFYRNGAFENAYLEFQKIASDTDTLAQYANFNMGDCYLKLNKKQNARLAYERAYNLGHLVELKEEALFHLARLSYELAYHQVAVKQLVEFINSYPESKNADEAKRILVELLLNTKNYKEAIPVLESIKNKNNDIKLAYQRVTYYRAEELYLNNDFSAAAALFAKSVNYNFDKKLYSLGNFWMGEILYREQKYDEAKSRFTMCLNYYVSEIKETKYYALAYYNLGYCELKQEHYSAALQQFEKFREAESFFGKQPQIYLDGCMRIADCYFKLQNYQKALDAYDYAIEKKANGSDYALYQKGTILGVLNKPEEKIKALRQIPAQFPRSGYIDDALFEIANTRLQQEDYENAIREFEYIMGEYPNSIYIRKVRLSLGLIYYNRQQDEKALAQLTRTVEEYPGSPESREALTTIKNIYIAKGEPDAYFDYLKTRKIGDINLTVSYQDSLSYESAFNQYKNGNCIKAVNSFGSYLTRFPEAAFKLQANFYKAECEYKDKQYDQAVIGYEYVLSVPRSDFSEKSARMAATIHYLRKEFSTALDQYFILEEYAQNKDNQVVAYLGQLRCAYKLQKTDTAFKSARKLLNFSGSTKEALIESNLIMGRIYMDVYQQPDSAQKAFEYVLKETKNVNAAEAKYNLALIAYQKKELNKAEKIIFDLNDNYNDYEYWVAKAFILLADVYLQKNDVFQAKATLQSIIDNYKGDDLNSIAREKLNLILDKEKQEKELKKQKEEKNNEQD